MLTIGTLASKAGTKVQTIRYYEQIGLMPQPERTQGGQRRYDQRQMDRLAFIRHSRQMGFPLDAIRSLLDLADSPNHSCAHVDQIASQQLKEVENRIARLSLLREELKRMLAECSGGDVSSCRVLEILHDHSECLQHHGDRDL